MSAGAEETVSGLFASCLVERYEASLACDEVTRGDVVNSVMTRCGLPRVGTSGAANAYVVIVGSQFGGTDADDTPHYSPASMGNNVFNDLWRLRVGEPNPHFDPEWSPLRNNTTLWKRLFTWLPEALGTPSQSHAMFAWANLSVTKGGSAHGTPSTHRHGMTHHVGPLIEASGARVVLATNEPTRIAVDEWAERLGAQRRQISDVAAWIVPVAGHTVVAGKAGHPSRGTSRADWVRRLRTFVTSAET